MYFVYLIRSIKNPEKTYVGCSNDLNQRLEKHNNGASIATTDFRPWKLISCIGFETQEKALVFEKYLKTGSGHAFAKKRLW